MAVAVACLTLDARSVRAQRVTTAELGADATRIVLDGYAGAVAGTFSGILTSDGDVLHAQAAAAASRFETGHTTVYGTAAATLDLIRAVAWRASWSADAGSGAFRGDVAGQYLRTAGRISYTHALTSVWVLGSIGQVHRGGTTQRGEAGEAGCCERPEVQRPQGERQQVQLPEVERSQDQRSRDGACG